MLVLIHTLLFVILTMALDLGMSMVTSRENVMGIPEILTDGVLFRLLLFMLLLLGYFHLPLLH